MYCENAKSLIEGCYSMPYNVAGGGDLGFEL